MSIEHMIVFGLKVLEPIAFDETWMNRLNIKVQTIESQLFITFPTDTGQMVAVQALPNGSESILPGLKIEWLGFAPAPTDMLYRLSENWNIEPAAKPQIRWLVEQLSLGISFAYQGPDVYVVEIKTDPQRNCFIAPLWAGEIHYGVELTEDLRLGFADTPELVWGKLISAEIVIPQEPVWLKPLEYLYLSSKSGHGRTFCRSATPLPEIS